MACNPTGAHAALHRRTAATTAAATAPIPTTASLAAALLDDDAPNATGEHDPASADNDAAPPVTSAAPADTQPAIAPTLAQAALVTILGFFATIDITGPDLHMVGSRSLPTLDRASVAATAPGAVLAIQSFLSERRSDAAFAFFMGLPRLLLGPSDAPDIVPVLRHRTSTLLSGDAKSLWHAFIADNPLPDGSKRNAIKDTDSDSFYREISATLTELSEAGGWSSMTTLLDAVPSCPPTRATFDALAKLQESKPIDPELTRLRDERFPHLAEGETITATWGSAYDLFSKADGKKLIAKWEPNISSLNELTAPDGTSWRGSHVKRFAKHAMLEFAMLHELVDRHLVTPRQLILLKSNSLIALLKPNGAGTFTLDNKKRPIGKNNRFQTSAFRPHARDVAKHGAPYLASLGQMGSLPCGIENTPRQLQITRDRHPTSIRRSEDAANAFPSLLRGSVLLGHRLLQARLRALPNPTDSERALIDVSIKSLEIYTVYRATPNNQWVNVEGTLLNLPASGACVQGGILDASDFAIPWTLLVVHPMRELDPDCLNALAIADDVYTEARNERPPPTNLPAITDLMRSQAAAAAALASASPSDLLLAARARFTTHAAAALASVNAAYHADPHPRPLPPDIAALATAAHMFISLAEAVGVSANTSKVETDQADAAAATALDLQPFLHLFPANPKPSADLPAILPLTRVGFKAVGAWVGTPEACNAYATKVIRRLDAKLARLLDPRMTCSLQVKYMLFRTCYSMQSAVTHLQRSMTASYIRAAMQLAMHLQHSTVCRLFHIPPSALPATLAEGASHPSLAIYRLHLTTNHGGAAIPNPLLSLHPANAGAAISGLPILALNPFHTDLASDPSTWLTCGIPLLSEPADAISRLCSTPAFFTDPPRYPDRHRAFRLAVAPSGSFSLANLADAAKRHPQSCLTAIQNATITADILGDTSLPDLTRASIRAGTAFNAGKALVPFYITRDNKLDNHVLRTLVQTTLGVRLSFISATSRCVDKCREYSATATAGLTIPGSFGNYYITLDWHQAGCHQLSCRVGSNQSGHSTIGSMKVRHDNLLRSLLEGFGAAGATIDASEIMVSPHDNRRADGAIYHPALGSRGIAIDVTVWNDLTLPRIAIAAGVSHWVLVAAEAYKTKKYETHCHAANFDFAALAANPRGGLGPTLERMWNTVWLDAIARAAAAGLPTRPIVSLERRHLERIAAHMARALHYSIWAHTTSRTTTDPPRPDPDPHTPQMPPSL